MSSSRFAELPRGKGRIFWASDPLELADADESVAKIYSYVIARARGQSHAEIQSDYDLKSSLSPGVLVYPVSLEDSVLYVFVSDNAEDENINIQDKVTGVQIAFRLSAEHAALALIGKKEKAVIAKYGF